MALRIGDLIRTKDTRDGWVIELLSVDEQLENWVKDSEDSDPPEFEPLAVVRFEDDTTEKINPDDLEITTPKVYVNVFLIDRQWGGPEEGGWWFDCGWCEETFRCRDEAHAKQVFDKKVLWAAEENRNRRSDISSVISEGMYVIELQAWPGEDWPAVTPHYE